MSRCRPTCVSVVRSRSSTRRASDVQPPRLSVAAVDRTARLRRRWKNWWSPWPGQRPTTPSPFKSRYNINPRLTIVTRFRFAQMEWTMGSWFPGQYFVTSHFCWGSVYSQQLRRQRWVYSPSRPHWRRSRLFVVSTVLHGDKKSTSTWMSVWTSKFSVFSFPFSSVPLYFPSPFSPFVFQEASPLYTTVGFCGVLAVLQTDGVDGGGRKPNTLLQIYYVWCINELYLENWLH